MKQLYGLYELIIKKILPACGKRKTDYGLQPATPGLLVIGSMNSGTTTLYQYLKQHPDIFMSRPKKEPEFFRPSESLQKKDATIRSRNEYLLKYMLKGYKGEKVFGEASTSYTFSDKSRKYEIPERIKYMNPDVRFIYILRNPLARIVSSYLHCLKIKRFKVNEVDFNNHLHSSVTTSLYFSQLNRYLPHFTKDQFKIVIFEEFINNPQAVLSDVFHFLDISDFKYNHTSYKYGESNREGFTHDDLKFTKNNYNKYIGEIKNDVRQMEEFLERSLDIWDLTEETWVKDKMI